MNSNIVPAPHGINKIVITVTEIERQVLFDSFLFVKAKLVSPYMMTRC